MRITCRIMCVVVLVLTGAVLASAQQDDLLSVTFADKPDTAWTPPPCTGVFTDVPCPGAQFVDWVEQLYADQITSGCGASTYCPNSPVTRRQMAVFMERAMRGTAVWTPPANTVGVGYFIVASGVWPAIGGQVPGEHFLGEIVMFAGSPTWMLIPCDGRLLQIASYSALYAVIGTTYGGDGVTTFAVPDLRGMLPSGWAPVGAARKPTGS